MSIDPRKPTPCARCLAATIAVSFLACMSAAAAKADAADAGESPRAAARKLDSIQVTAQRYLPDYSIRNTHGSTRTDTPLLDVPQAVTVVTDKLVADQAITSLGDAFRYMPGIGTAQGEGNRDTPVMRGNSTTGDFFVDGIRDDVQYFRDMYNLDRIEAIKGPNAMIFGRGGSGGVINRITRKADGVDLLNGTLQFGSHQRRRGTLDFGRGIGTTAGFRLNAVLEDSESYRDDVRLKRHGVNPTYGIDLGPDTNLDLSYERFDDERTADRGVPSFQGRPIDVHPSTFFGNPALSVSAATVDAFDAALEHRFSPDLELRNHLRAADYDKMYQNVFPGAVSTGGTTVSLAAYRNETTRRNLFNQTDLVWNLRAGAVEHTLLAGVELGRQTTDNVRLTGHFAPGDSVVSVLDPNVRVPVSFSQSASDADNHSVAKISALYLQNQIAFSPRWLAILGLRHDDFRVDLTNRRNGDVFHSKDRKNSPRAGIVFKPTADVSLYASLSRAFQPRAGDQLASLNAGNAALEPESFRNRELGAKWDIRRDLQASLAVYRLDRRNVAVVDPDDPARMRLTDGQVTRGVEIGLAGRISDAWQVMGGYAHQNGELLEDLSASARKGNRLAQLPRHSASLWNRYDFTPRLGAGLGIVHRGAVFANVDNQVTLPAFTRLDAALYWSAAESVQLQINIENLTNKRYFASAHSNNNITPGAPRSAWISLNFAY